MIKLEDVVQVSVTLPRELLNRGEYNFDKPSRAVVVQGEQGGAIAWTVGGHVRDQIQSVGSDLEYLGLEAPGPGVWVWEGLGVWTPGSHECPADGDYDLVGKWRLPYRHEWELLLQGRCPWNDEAWMWPGTFTRMVLQLARPADGTEPAGGHDE